MDCYTMLFRLVPIGRRLPQWVRTESSATAALLPGHPGSKRVYGSSANFPGTCDDVVTMHWKEGHYPVAEGVLQTPDQLEYSVEKH